MGRGILPGMTARHTRAGGLPALLASAVCSVLVLALGACDGGGSSGGGAFTVNGAGFDTAAAGHRQTAPDITGPTVDGGTVHLSDFSGKVVVVNVWGSWCPPCRAEAPDFGTTYEKYRDRGVQFLGVNTRDPSPGQARQFEKRFHIPYPSIFDPPGRQILRFPKGTLNPQFIPSTLVIDRKGDIAARALKPLGGDALEQELNAVLAEKG